MKLADYVASFLASIGTTKVFCVSGGASLHLIHGIDKTKNIDNIFCHHEQSAAMAADAYSRVSNRMGVAITSSGPGATNLVTGICGCYYDSVPALFITGQVATFRMSKNDGVRQVGFQETPIVQMVSTVTKYSVQINDPSSIKCELEKAIYMAKEGRPGPVLIDIPDDIQRQSIDPADLKGFSMSASNINQNTYNSKSALSEINDKLQKASRPIVIAGWGIHLSRSEQLFREFIEKLDIPVALTWGAADLLESDHPLRIGTFGTHGCRYANFAVQNADFILSIGSRLDTKATGSPPKSFAREAWKVVVDISNDELCKFEDYGLKIDRKIQADARNFIETAADTLKPGNWTDWICQIRQWKEKYAITKETRQVGDQVDPYQFFSQMSEHISDNAQVWSDTGSTIAWLMQSFQPRGYQRLWHDFNNTAMGWAVPASIACKAAFPNLETYCVTGDGSLMMNLQELQTMVTYKLPIKVICIDNGGYSMIQQTQDQWLDSKYVGSSNIGGLGLPDFLKIAHAFGFEVENASTSSEALKKLRWLRKCKSPAFLLINVDSNCRVTPQVKYGRPNEDPEPLLNRAEFRQQMIVKPI